MSVAAKINGWPDPMRAIGLAARARLVRHVPGLKETILHGSPTFSLAGTPRFALTCEPKSVVLEFLGRPVPAAPNGWLIRSGGRCYVDLATQDAVTDPTFLALLSAAARANAA
ncbi:MAG: hypothetical protein AAF638_13600 [Pseudomonadota bacterium]